MMYIVYRLGQVARGVIEMSGSGVHDVISVVWVMSALASGQITELPDLLSGSLTPSCLSWVPLCVWERNIFIFPWLQVLVTGPRHHLASSLQIRVQGIWQSGTYLHRVSGMMSKVCSPVWCEVVYTLLLLLFTVVAFPWVRQVIS